MLVVHVLCTAGGWLALWAEDSAMPTRVSGRARRATLAHPYAAGESLLDQLGLSTDDIKTETLPVLLPSYPSAPMTSPELIRDPLTSGTTARGQPRLKPWLVPAIICETTVAAAALVDLPAADARLGASAHYVRAVASFAEDLVARGKVLPELDTSGPLARWRPALTGADSERMGVLREAMPPVLRAEPADTGHSEGRSRAEVLRTMTNTMVDGLVRHRLTEHAVRLTPPRRGRAAASEAVEAWLNALVGEPRFDADAEQVRQLDEQLTAWRASGLHDSPVRTCFRLRSPEQHHDDDADWRLEFLLQAVDDPSVVVPAREVWREHSGVLQRWIDYPQELLLTELGRASRLYPALDAALRSSHPAELPLDATGAYEFLTHSTLLDQAGFGVFLPSWWTKPVNLGMRLTTSSTGTVGTVTKESGTGLDALVDYRWDLALGDEELTETEMAELATAKVPLVRLRGEWVQVDQKRLAEGMAFLRRSANGQMSAADVLRHAGMSPEDSPTPLPVTTVASDGWLGDLLSGDAEQHLEPVRPPEEFHAVLRPYQQRGLAWLAFLDRLGLGACLADDMGLGKTIQVLALETLARGVHRPGPTLLVCPMSLTGNWQREAARFAPELSVYVHHGADRHTGEELIDVIGEHDFIITTYALAVRDAVSLAAVHWHRVVLDEAQNIKNSNSRQSQAVRHLHARHRIALTGTPVENRLAELWSIMDFINPGALGTVHSFRARFAVPVERDGDTDSAARLRRITGPFVLRRLKTDPTILDDLPDKVEMRQLCTLTPEQASLYQAVMNDMFARIADSDGIERRGLILATMSKLKQVCNHPAHLLRDGSALPGRSGKLLRLEEILEQVLADGDKALCFTQFTEFGGLLVPYLAARFDTEVLFLHGGTRKADRDAMVRRFQSAEGPAIFFLSLKAGGTGLNLTAANHVVHLDRWWNPAVEDQATDRAFRIGQRRDVQVRKLTCIGTLEEKIDQMIQDKKALAQLVVSAGENWLTELSTSSLRDLFTLSSEAVGE